MKASYARVTDSDASEGYCFDKCRQCIVSRIINFYLRISVYFVIDAIVTLQ